MFATVSPYRTELTRSPCRGRGASFRSPTCCVFRSVSRILVTAALRHLSKARRIIAFATLRAAVASPPLSRGMSAALAATKQSYCPPASKNGRVCPMSGYSGEHDGESRLRRGAAAHGSGPERQNGGSGMAQSRRYHPHGARPHSDSAADYTTRNCKREARNTAPRAPPFCSALTQRPNGNNGLLSRAASPPRGAPLL